MSLGKTITELNASYEAALLKHLTGANIGSAREIDLAEPFFGIEWGAVEGNVQRQRWRWLGPLGQSHLFLKLATETDHQIRVYIHTAASGQVLDELTALANGTCCTHQGHDWGADGVASHWCIVERERVAERRGIVKITWSLPSAGETPQSLDAGNDPGRPAFARLIAFSRVSWDPYPLPQSTKAVGVG